MTQHQMRNEKDMLIAYTRCLRRLSDTVVGKAPFGLRVKGLTDEEVLSFAVELTKIATLAWQPDIEDVTDTNK